MSRARWTSKDLPSLQGKVFVVTGANSGIGFEASRGLAGAGAHVVMACRKQALAEDAIATIRAEHPRASLEFGPLDLADLASVRRFANDVVLKHPRLDVLVNNAGVMALPYLKTADGFEMQFGTNHLGHFALTGLLLGALRCSDAPRVVNVSSSAHNLGTIRFDDLQGEKRYRRWLAYGQSKLANLLFTYELQRRLDAHAIALKSVACHPGYANTNLQLAAARMEASTAGERFWRTVNGNVAQSTEMGALPTLYAAAAEDVEGGGYYGPDGLFELWGYPKKVRSNARSRDEAVAAELWDVSERLTGVAYTFGG